MGGYPHIHRPYYHQPSITSCCCKTWVREPVVDNYAKGTRVHICPVCFREGREGRKCGWCYVELIPKLTPLEHVQTIRLVLRQRRRLTV